MLLLTVKFTCDYFMQLQYVVNISEAVHRGSKGFVKWKDRSGVGNYSRARRIWVLNHMCGSWKYDDEEIIPQGLWLGLGPHARTATQKM